MKAESLDEELNWDILKWDVFDALSEPKYKT